MTLRYDITGQKFNRLIAVKQEGVRRGSLLWLTQCDCGKQLFVTSYKLRKGFTKSCGCLRTEKLSVQTHRKLEDPTESAFNSLYVNYRAKAISRGYIFEITKESFRLYTKQNCVHCGIEPYRIARNGKSEYVYNGLDRINNNIGYTEDNVVACCWECNQAKHDKTNDQFEAWLERITKYRNNK